MFQDTKLPTFFRRQSFPIRLKAKMILIVSVVAFVNENVNSILMLPASHFYNFSFLNGYSHKKISLSYLERAMYGNFTQLL